MDDFLIRQAGEQDIERIGEMWEKLVTYHQQLDERLPQASERGGELYGLRIIQHLEDTHTRILVAEVDGRLVGYTMGMILDLVPEMFRPQIGGFLADIFVEPDFRRNGIGGALVEALVAWFRSRGVQYMEWYAASQNQAGRAFWEALGGHEIMIRMRTDL